MEADSMLWANDFKWGTHEPLLRCVMAFTCFHDLTRSSRLRGGYSRWRLLACSCVCGCVHVCWIETSTERRTRFMVQSTNVKTLWLIWTLAIFNGGHTASIWIHCQEAKFCISFYALDFDIVVWSLLLGFTILLKVHWPCLAQSTYISSLLVLFIVHSLEKKPEKLKIKTAMWWKCILFSAPHISVKPPLPSPQREYILVPFLEQRDLRQGSEQQLEVSNIPARLVHLPPPFDFELILCLKKKKEIRTTNI